MIKRAIAIALEASGRFRCSSPVRFEKILEWKIKFSNDSNDSRTSGELIVQIIKRDSPIRYHTLGIRPEASLRLGQIVSKPGDGSLFCKILTNSPAKQVWDLPKKRQEIDLPFKKRHETRWDAGPEREATEAENNSNGKAKGKLVPKMKQRQRVFQK